MLWQRGAARGITKQMLRPPGAARGIMERSLPRPCLVESPTPYAIRSKRLKNFPAVADLQVLPKGRNVGRIGQLPPNLNSKRTIQLRLIQGACAGRGRNAPQRSLAFPICARNTMPRFGDINLYFTAAARFCAKLRNIVYFVCFARPPRQFYPVTYGEFRYVHTRLRAP